MAIIIRGSSKCSLCGKVIEDGQDVVAFSPFVGNELDPLWIFNDRGFHRACFEAHPLAGEAQASFEKGLEQARFHRFCVVCKKEIMEPDDYFATGYLTADASDPLYRYNYVHAHLSHLPGWPELPYLYELIKDMKEAGSYRGKALDRLEDEIRSALYLT